MKELLSGEEFSSVIFEALDDLPPELASRMANVEVEWKHLPGPEAGELEGNGELLGLYHGIPLTERGENYFLVLPDRITIYKSNLERIAASKQDLRVQIRRTVIHEVAHHFGIDDDRLVELGWD